MERLPAIKYIEFDKCFTQFYFSCDEDDQSQIDLLLENIITAPQFPPDWLEIKEYPPGLIGLTVPCENYDLLLLSFLIGDSSLYIAKATVLLPDLDITHLLQEVIIIRESLLKINL